MNVQKAPLAIRPRQKSCGLDLAALRPLVRECHKRVPVQQPDRSLQFPVKANDTSFAKLGEGAGDGFDCQSKIVSDVTARHHHVEFRFSGMTFGHLLNEGRNAFQCALFRHDELFLLGFRKIRQGDIQEIHWDDRILVGRKRPYACFADRFREIGSNLSLFEPEPLAFAAKGQNVSVPVRHQPIDPDGSGFDLVDRQRIFAFTIDGLIGFKPDGLIFRRSGHDRVVTGVCRRRLLPDDMALKHLRCPPYTSQDTELPQARLFEEALTYCYGSWKSRIGV